MIAAANVFMAKTQSRQPGIVVTDSVVLSLRLGARRAAPRMFQMDCSIEITPGKGCSRRCAVARRLTGASSKSGRTRTASGERPAQAVQGQKI